MYMHLGVSVLASLWTSDNVYASWCVCASVCMTSDDVRS